ncbi:MAG: 16S rRNA (guanine(527)-N(7))-methyltransferase RsmG [Pseudomonadota bacterium]
MTEDEARDWVEQQFGGDAVARLAAYGAILVAENDRQNLISPMTVPTLWPRHIVDSAQLLQLAPADWQHWADIGAGAGLPGLVVAILEPQRQVTLIEPRRLRVEFLKRCADEFALANVVVVQAKAERVRISHADVVSARAVAPLDVLLSASTAAGFGDVSTTYLFPKGASANSEVDVASVAWQGAFHVEQSIVDPESGIVVAKGVARR